jgi:hypothetical protein
MGLTTMSRHNHQEKALMLVPNPSTVATAATAPSWQMSWATVRQQHDFDDAISILDQCSAFSSNGLDTASVSAPEQLTFTLTRPDRTRCPRMPVAQRTRQYYVSFGRQVLPRIQSESIISDGHDCQLLSLHCKELICVY